MKFIIEVIDKQVQRLEEQDDTVFSARLLTLIVKELQEYNSDVYRASVKVIEVAETEQVIVKSRYSERTV